MRNERTNQLVLGFMALATLYFLALVFAGAMGARTRLDQVVIFGFGAAFGLEFLWTSWSGLWKPDDGRSIG